MGKKTKENDRLDQWPAYLRGPAQNRHGGHQVQRVRVYRGNTFGPASKCRSLSKEEIAAYAKQNGLPC